jgi:hypothetical protein
VGTSSWFVRGSGGHGGGHSGSGGQEQQQQQQQEPLLDPSSSHSNSGPYGKTFGGGSPYGDGEYFGCLGSGGGGGGSINGGSSSSSSSTLLSVMGRRQATHIEGPTVYYLGVIDILQKWDWRKRLERFAKVRGRQSLTFSDRSPRNKHDYL